MAIDEGHGGAARVVVFLFTDIEGSTRQWERDPAAMRTALARHDALVSQAIARHGGRVFKTIGDGFCAVFGDPGRALGAAVDIQRDLHAEAWPEPIRIRVRVALHAGPAEERDGDFFGPHVNRVSRLLAVASGGQVVLSQPFVERVRGALLGEIELTDVGDVPLKDIAEPEHVYGLVVPGLADAASYARAPDAPRHNLPVLRTPLIGRERELAALEAL
ncbi:MAG: adenylate/guanylate cyclase domain-containing protein, partial [Chloroflexota bacterium]|nr:adenylate/guanylate cyclase domain-containing protein [Chloroflexota bacterium]